MTEQEPKNAKDEPSVEDESSSDQEPNQQDAQGNTAGAPKFVTWLKKLNLGSLLVAVLLALAIRSFLFAAYKIPSGSMIPTLLVGDQLIVDKLTPGFRLPFADDKLIYGHRPENGDVVIFRYPRDPSIDFIKRTIGVSGDTIRLEGTDIWVNGKKVQRLPAGTYTYTTESGRERTADRFQEKLGKHRYYVLYDHNRAFESAPMEFKVPKDKFFMMGDNRDRSNDSRVWGFVPVRDLEGRPLFIHFSWNHYKHDVRWKRIGTTLP